MKKSEILVPTVHLNGTSKDDLVRGLRGIVDALDIALSAIQDAWPHGRDYYVVGIDYADVRRQWERRRDDLARARDEFHHVALRTQYPDSGF